MFKDLGLPSIIVVAAIADVACYIILARGLLVLALEIIKAAQSSMVKSSMVKEPQKAAGTPLACQGHDALFVVILSPLFLLYSNIIHSKSIFSYDKTGSMRNNS